jgi:branched-subunit amino acid transport protein
MSEVWIVVVAVGVLTIAMKALGPMLLGGRELPGTITALVPLLAPALLAALVAINTVADDGELVIDARLPGVVVAAVAIALKAPVLVVVVAAAVVTAVVRAAG